MIRLNYTYSSILLETFLAGYPADSEMSVLGVIWRNGQAVDSSIVPVYVDHVGTGEYFLSFTTKGAADGWSVHDKILLRVTVVLGGQSYVITKFNSVLPGGGVSSGGSSSPGSGWPKMWGVMNDSARHEVFTLQDIVHSLTLRSGADPDKGHNARMVKAVQSAIRSLHSKHPWHYYKKQTRFNTSPQVSMEIEYTHSGSDYERLARIISDEVWPEDAEHGEVFIENVAYRVASRISDKLATLEQDHSLSQDYLGSAIWRRRSYSFGREILKVEYCHNVSANRQITSLPYHEFSALAFAPIVIGNTRHFTWQNHGGKFGGSEFILHPSPISKEIIEVSASVLPIVPFVHSVYGEGLAGDEGSNVVVSATGGFSPKLVGAVLRISAGGDPPVGYDNDLWDFQTFITEVDGSTTLKTSDPLPQEFLNSGYSISSPLDIEASVMLEALEDEAFYQYTKNHDHKQAAVAAEMSRKSLMEAMSRDKRSSENSMDSGAPFWSWNKTDFSQAMME